MAHVVIKAGQATSNAVDLNEDYIKNLIFPAAFTGATVSFKASINGRDFYPVYDDEGTLVTVTATDGAYVTNLLKLAGIRFLQIVSASNEAADRVITIDTA